MQYFKNIFQAIRTIAAGLRVTLPYNFARTVVVQYPDVEPALQERYRGFHVYQIERCIACEACARACPAECITVGKTGARKLDKTRDIVVGGAMTEYKINHSTCLLCGLCTEVCPTECLKMGQLHDNSCFSRADLITDYVQLAKEGRRTINPLWLQKEKLPAWAVKVRDYWNTLDPDKRELMARSDDPEYCRKLAEPGPGGKEAGQ
jgi:NADH-quinone oxidoreductase subunit I